jgi:hypothetical protein
MLVSNKNFLIPIENFHPNSKDYLDFWRMFKRACIEGYWSGGKWMPPQVFFYINGFKIKAKENELSKTLGIASPTLRDLEWEKGYLFTEARGFSGFELDKKFTCDLKFKDSGKDNLGRTYVDARTYLRKNHGTNLGKALYANPARNIVDVEARGTGKSFFASGCIAQNFLFDGATDYDYYLTRKKNNEPLSSETLIGAIDASKSTDLADKFLNGLEYLPGKQKIKLNGITTAIPSPISVSFQGGLGSADYIEAFVKVKENGQWEERGSHSKVHNRVFANNPVAGNGLRPNLVLLEEAGFFGNLVESLNALIDCVSIDMVQMGTVWIFGTGGQMKSGQTKALKKVFYSPETYNCLSFEDIYENTGKQIGLFIPSHMKYNDARNSEGVIDKNKALDLVNKARTSDLSKDFTKDIIDSKKQNNPEVPSEAFLEGKGSIFPVEDLTNWLGVIESDTTGKYIPQKGELIVNEKGVVQWLPDLKNKFTIADYPVTPDDKDKGCITIWEHPVEGEIPYNLYVGGCDPYDHDIARSSHSLGSFFIYKTFSTKSGTHEFLVAEYTGRPESAKNYYEAVRRLCIYYNCRVLHENEKNGIKMYFENTKSLGYMADTPQIHKINMESSVKGRGNKGVHATVQIKSVLITETRDWLLTDRGDGLLNLHSIYSIGLLKELIFYNDIDNFDRADAFFLTLLHRQQVHLRIQDKLHSDVYNNDLFFKRRFDSKKNLVF